MKQRLDVYLVAKGLVQSRERAKELIENGQVLVCGKPAKKAGQPINETDEIQIQGEQNPYVSRGGLKLKKAIDCFGLNLTGKTAMDIGASTGGFTQCMLEHGAKKVYAIDVGTGQLHPSLAENPRVINLEQTNIRFLTPEQAEKADFISIDVSFISLTLVLPAAKAFLKPGGCIVALIKPQFEAGKAKVGKKGVVKDKKTHLAVVREIWDFAKNIGLYPAALDFSPVRGPEGNIEYLVLLSDAPCDNPISPEQVVESSHQSL